MAKEIKFSIKLNVDGKEQLVFATTTTKQLQDVVQGAQTAADKLRNSLISINQGFEIIGNLTSAARGLCDQFTELSRQAMAITQVTGATGEEMQNLRTEVQSVATFYGKDFAEVLRSVNALAKGFGISAGDAMRLVRDGFASGADAGGYFLDTVREYPRYFKEAGLSAEDFIAISTNAARQGVFSDKGVDAIKEANIRLREMLNPPPRPRWVALGCVGLSLADFCALTPAEFRSVCASWGRHNEGLEQGSWERMRLLATITIQPHVKKRLTPGQPHAPTTPCCAR